MSKRTKSFVYNLLSFAVFFLPLQVAVSYFTNLRGIWIPMTAFVVGTILAPKFQAVNTRDGEKLFMKWLFVKGVKEIE
jgi:Na+-driven multidrug efflux pump